MVLVASCADYACFICDEFPWVQVGKTKTCNEHIIEALIDEGYDLFPQKEYDPVGGGGGSHRSDLPYGMGGGGD